MTQDELLQNIVQRLAVLEEELHRIREDIERVNETKQAKRVDLKRQMAEAAELLKDDYANDEELTIFTTLDGEDYYEPE
jgi:hypothetical protein